MGVHMEDLSSALEVIVPEAPGPREANGELPEVRCEDQNSLELFRRATVDHDHQAWELLQRRFYEIVLSWMRRHPKREIAGRLDSEDNYVAQAFERFWQATAFNRALEFTSLAAALTYLRASLNGAIMDTLRMYARPREAPLPEPGYGAEPAAEEADTEGDELWEALRSLLPQEREQRLAYLLFHCGLKPREVVRYCPQEFSDVREVYRLRRNIIERLMRNIDQIRWRLGTHEL
jgi:hypothetical protein